MVFKDQKDTSAVLIAHPSVVFKLGEDLITDDTQALLELVKNAYDADSPNARIEVDTESVGQYSGTGKLQGQIRIVDRGTGIAASKIQDTWLTISNSVKREMKASGGVTKKGRTPVGDKGLGRLAAQRLGRVLVLATRPGLDSSERRAMGLAPNQLIEHRIEIDWEKFDSASDLNAVKLTIHHGKTTRAQGTDVIVAGLRDPSVWDSGNLSELQNHLVRLVSPFGKDRGFSVSLRVNGQDVDVYELAKSTRDAAAICYSLDYAEGVLTAKGQFSLAGLDPDVNDPRKVDWFTSWMREDRGKGFLEWLLAERPGKSESLSLRQTRGKHWIASIEAKVLLREKEPVFVTHPVGIDQPEPTLGRARGRFQAGDDSATPDESEPQIADPGPFNGEVDIVWRRSNHQTEDRASEIARYVRDVGGVRIYRDGFGINVPNDWMKLAESWSSGSSWYGIRPGNVIGYIDLTAEHNSLLEETTNREGFRRTPYYDNFMKLIDGFKDWSNGAQGTLRRELTRYQKEISSTWDDAPPDLPSAESAVAAAAAVSGEATKALSALNESLGTAIAAGEESATLEEIREHVTVAQKAVADLSTVGQSATVIGEELDSIREQLSLSLEMMAVGLSAEVLVHEVLMITDRLVKETARVSPKIEADGDKQLLRFLDVVAVSLSALRKQAGHVIPATRFLRDKRQDVAIGTFITELAVFNRERLEGEGIAISVTNRNDFMARVNEGRLTQVLDNLIRNSEYWLRQAIRSKDVQSAKIQIMVSDPVITVSDNGWGIDPVVENRLFEPFVTTKPKGRGRGLGLYVAEQLLDAMGGTISLDDVRNDGGRKFRFRVDLGSVASEQ